MAPGAIRIHPESPNVCLTSHRNKGDAEKAISESAAVIEADFSTQLNHQAPLERKQAWPILKVKVTMHS